MRWSTERERERDGDRDRQTETEKDYIFVRGGNSSNPKEMLSRFAQFSPDFPPCSVL